ncbi:uncharacterized protein PgNI_07005 [Pyricularia grisea]|uniref:Uncharacterized protein n=1 Tax=Pyricularia grisea TaxID=148305 RepID=A0A6P8B2I2_PYRGI|nr:uncharacterized protein PgNI_07005 [Pyricularia grisea]TLD08923.1 hypothetical protein PgNI_07005 [Pyricularia grisea]
MSDGTANRRLEAISRQVSASGSAGASSSSSASLPKLVKVAGDSTAPRALGKVVIITGANSPMGIGRATAHQFAQNGARAVYLCDFDDSHLEAHKTEIASLYGPSVDVHVRQFDASDEAAVKAVVDDAVARYGRLDVFFANAGIVGPATMFQDVDAEGFMRCLTVNTLGPFLAAKHGAAAMTKVGGGGKSASGGSIIMTASVAGLRSNAGPTPYSASKAAVVSMAQTLSYQLTGTGVRVNAICPGLIETGMTAPLFEMARQNGNDKKIGQLNPLRRAAHADEVARVALFLGSDESSYVNGQAWAVDGGLSAGHPYVPGKMS